MLHEEIKASLKDALKAKDEVRLRTVRSIITALTNEAVATGGTPQTMLSDEVVLGVIKRLAKQRKDSIEQYTAGNRPELADAERAELMILDAYLPALLTQEQLRPIVAAKIAELGISDKSKMGIIVGALMKDLAGKADGADVKALVTELLV